MFASAVNSEVKAALLPREPDTVGRVVPALEKKPRVFELAPKINAPAPLAASLKSILVASPTTVRPGIVGLLISETTPRLPCQSEPVTGDVFALLPVAKDTKLGVNLSTVSPDTEHRSASILTPDEGGNATTISSVTSTGEASVTLFEPHE